MPHGHGHTLHGAVLSGRRGSGRDAYREPMGHDVDHDYTFLETLKAIYRGVS